MRSVLHGAVLGRSSRAVIDSVVGFEEAAAESGDGLQLVLKQDYLAGDPELVDDLCAILRLLAASSDGLQNLIDGRVVVLIDTARTVAVSGGYTLSGIDPDHEQALKHLICQLRKLNVVLAARNERELHDDFLPLQAYMPFTRRKQ